VLQSIPKSLSSGEVKRCKTTACTYSDYTTVITGSRATGEGEYSWLAYCDTQTLVLAAPTTFHFPSSAFFLLPTCIPYGL
jgi:hypothetical protein